MMTDETPSATENPAPPLAPAGTEEPKVPAPVPEEAPPPAEELVRDQAVDPTAVAQAGESAEASESEPVEAAPPPAPAEAAAVVEEPPSNKHWYVVKVQSGREETIKEAIEKKVKIEGLEECFGQIYIPTEKVTEMRNNKRYTRTRKVLPGYIMAEVEYNDRILYLFRETSGVGDFVGAQPHLEKPPIPMSEREIVRVLGVPLQLTGTEAEVALRPRGMEVGDKVRVVDGTFN